MSTEQHVCLRGVIDSTSRNSFRKRTCMYHFSLSAKMQTGSGRIARSYQ